MMKNMERVVFGGLVLLMLPISGFACSTGQWDATSGSVIVGTPKTNPAVPRLSELCGLQITAPGTGYVQDNSPDGHTKFIARFYVRPNLTGAGQADLFVAYSAENGTGQLVKVSYDGTNLDFHAASTPVASVNNLDKTRWHLVEIEYNAAGTTKFWVDVDAEALAPPTGTFATAGAGAVSSVRLGLPNSGAGFTGVAQFDAYESHSTTPVGALVIGDANNDGNINSGDTVKIVNENLGDVLANGQPDCNRDGAINSGDTVCIVNKSLGS